MNTTEVSLAVFCWCVYGLGAIGIMEIDRIYPRPSNPRVWWHLVIAFIGGRQFCGFWECTWSNPGKSNEPPIQGHQIDGPRVPDWAGRRYLHRHQGVLALHDGREINLGAV